MTHKVDFRQNIKVECQTVQETIKVYNWLVNNVELNGGEWDIFESRPTTVEGSEHVKGFYTPAKYYTPNGDGNPEIIELDEGVSEEWLEDEIRNKAGLFVRVNIDIEGVESCTGCDYFAKDNFSYCRKSEVPK